MTVYQLDQRLLFPDPSEADENGLLAVGGDLSSERLLLAYSLGIFPWYNEGLPILWYSPPMRMVLEPEVIHVPRSLAKKMRKQHFEIRYDTSFADVIEACALVPRDHQDGTWITSDMIRAYRQLHDLGFAHSVESWIGGELVGGLYGVSLGGAFFGESMFQTVSDASKVAFVTLVEQLAEWSFDLVDCQMYTGHLARFGAHEVPRAAFAERLGRSLARRTRRGSWTCR